MTNTFNQPIIDEFRANKGQVGGPFEGARLLLLTTTGARSGRPHTVPLGYLPDDVQRILIIGSAGGGHRHPAWYHNVLADPHVTVEDGLFTYQAAATVLAGKERDLLFARAVEADPGWGVYQQQTSRILPVVALEPTQMGPPNAGSPSATLLATHEAFRRDLALIRADVTSAGASVVAQLRINCLTLCQGLQHHHAGEDLMMFPHVVERYPRLRSAMEQLQREHEQISDLLTSLQHTVSAVDADPEMVKADVERLIDALDGHLTYEEEQLIPILDSALSSPPGADPAAASVLS